MTIIWPAMIQRPTHCSVPNMNVRIIWKLHVVTADDWIVVLKEAYNNLKHSLNTAMYMPTIYFHKRFTLQMGNKSIRLFKIYKWCSIRTQLRDRILTVSPKEPCRPGSNDALPWRESLICVAYSGPPDGREDLWNKAVIPTTWLALWCVNHMIDT